MAEKFFKALLVAGIFYVISVLYGLISFYSLQWVFFTSLQFFLLGLAVGLFFQYLPWGMEKLADIFSQDSDQQQSSPKASEKYQQNQENFQSDRDRSKTDNEAGRGAKQGEKQGENSQDDFTPLDPPILETEEND